MNYKALALDLDGTLTDSKKQVPDDNKKAVIEAIEAGVCIILASGRPVFGMKPVADALELDKRGGYILACNGGVVVDARTGEIISSIDFPKECIKDVVELARANKVYALTYSGTQIVGESDTDEYVMKEAICNYTTVKKVEDMIEYVSYPVPKFLVVGEHNNLLKVQEELLKKHNDKINAYFSEQYFLEVVPLGVEKGEVLKKLLKSINIKSEELIACGDGMNDISMLDVADLSVAMENAHEEVKAHAKYIAPANDECGVSDVIRKFILARG